jgi:two-component system, NarL family, nitrate/nitrite response regulator NarL
VRVTSKCDSASGHDGVVFRQDGGTHVEHRPHANGQVLRMDLLILSDIRFVREGLTQVLGRNGAFAVAAAAVDVGEASALICQSCPRVILIDTALPGGIAAVTTLRSVACDAKIVAFALSETEAEVISWARAGIHGYIPRNTPLDALVELLNSIIRGEQVVGSRVAAGLLHWISRNPGNTSSSEVDERQVCLTAREQEVGRLLGAGLSNKEIARQLGITLATTKSHVHNILGKTGAPRRAVAACHLQAEQHLHETRARTTRDLSQPMALQSLRDAE